MTRIAVVMVVLALLLPQLGAWAADDPVIAVDHVNQAEARRSPPFPITAVHLRQLAVGASRYGLAMTDLEQVSEDKAGYLKEGRGYIVCGPCYNATAVDIRATTGYPGIFRYFKTVHCNYAAHFQMGIDGNHVTFFGRLPEICPKPRTIIIHEEAPPAPPPQVIIKKEPAPPAPPPKVVVKPEIEVPPPQVVVIKEAPPREAPRMTALGAIWTTVQKRGGTLVIGAHERSRARPAKKCDPGGKPPPEPPVPPPDDPPDEPPCPPDDPPDPPDDPPCPPPDDRDPPPEPPVP